MTADASAAGARGGAERAGARPEARLSPARIAGIWVRHLTSLLLPVNALAFLWTGPHPWYVAPLFVLPTIGAFLLDSRAKVERRQPVPTLPAWPFDLLVYLLAALQILVIVGIGRMFAQQDLFSVDMVMMFVVVGGSSGFSIITAHELIHRRKPWERTLGRLLLCTVLQEHFFTEHLRGHHVRVGRDDDPATARFGETYRDFYRRTVPAQFRSAWQLEARRQSDLDLSFFDRMLRNRIVQGVVVGWSIALTLWAVCGLPAFVAFLIQAFFASRLLEAVNYFEHWGLRRSGNRVRPQDSWDTHSWFTYYGLTGLSRHADHHYEQTRPFQQLRVYEDVPMLPGGYVVMVDLVMEKNEEFQRLATEELRRRQLGPFAPGAPNAAAVSELAAVDGAAEALAGAGPGRWATLPIWLRRGVLALGFLAFATIGAELEAAEPAGLGLGVRFFWNALILGAFVALFRAHALLQARGLNEGFAWALVLSGLVGVGLAMDRILPMLV